MLEKEVLERLSYKNCNCEIDVRNDIGIVNAICPNHYGSILMFDGVPVKDYLRLLEKKKKLANKKS